MPKASEPLSLLLIASAWENPPRFVKSRHQFHGVGVVFLYNLLDLKRTIWEGPELELASPGLLLVLLTSTLDFT